jgi:hypothetical protein
VVTAPVAVEVEEEVKKVDAKEEDENVKGKWPQHFL